MNGSWSTGWPAPRWAAGLGLALAMSLLSARADAQPAPANFTVSSKKTAAPTRWHPSAAEAPSAGREQQQSVPLPRHERPTMSAESVLPPPDAPPVDHGLVGPHRDAPWTPPLQSQPARRRASPGTVTPAAQFLPGPMLPPPENNLLQIPMIGPDPAQRIDLHSTGDRVSMVVRGAPLNVVLEMIAQEHRLNLVAGAQVTGLVSLTLSDVKLEEALDAILTVNGYTWVRRGDILLISAVSSDSSALPLAQGRLMRVFPLSYASAVEADKVVKGLLSPVGQSFVTESSPLDKRKTREAIVVEDLPEYLSRIESYLCQIDQPPRQVLIEAHVLQVDLSDDSRNGVDFGQILEIAETGVTLQTRGFTSALANPAFFFGIEGEDMTSVIEALQSTTDAKTLASPKVFAVNGQEARIQIGGRFGYFVTTTTQTSTLQSVEFLEVGVVLRVTPIISDDNQILMTVMPEVSNGRVNRDTGLPEEETTEVQTTVLLPDGQAMVIGGLLRETDRDVQSKPPFIGDLWMVGRLFQRRASVRERTEIIIALRPRIVPCPELQEPREQAQTLRARTPLFTPALRRIDRRLLEPSLTDAVRRPLQLWRPELLHPARWFGPPPPTFPMRGGPHGPPPIGAPGLDPIILPVPPSELHTPP